MSMQDKMVYVIKNENGYYVNPKFGALFSGITSGFIFYNNKDIIKQDLKKLNDKHYSEYINLKDIPRGKRIYYD
jgi:hypothetical protein